MCIRDRFGEAVVIMNENLKKDFRFIMKQRGGRMAKGLSLIHI